jgi:hypothetical protein
MHLRKQLLHGRDVHHNSMDPLWGTYEVQSLLFGDDQTESSSQLVVMPTKPVSNAEFGGLVDRYDPDGELAQSLAKYAEMKRKAVADEARELYFRKLGCRWIDEVIDLFLLQEDEYGEKFDEVDSSEFIDYVYGKQFLDILNAYCECKCKGNAPS